MGTEFVEQQFDPPYSTQAESSRHKIESALPAHVRTRMEEFRQSTKVLNLHRSTGEHGFQMTVLARIRGALLADKKYVLATPSRSLVLTKSGRRWRERSRRMG